MNISRERLHDLIDRMPDDRLAYIDDVFSQILRSELHSFQRVEAKPEANTPNSKMITSVTLEDIFSDHDV